jgi:hypothetical protein
MIKIQSYVSRFESIQEHRAAESRFVAYADGVPALMIEFFQHDYQIYGPRAGTVDEILHNALLAMSYAASREKFIPEFPSAGFDLEFLRFVEMTFATEGESGSIILDRTLFDRIPLIGPPTSKAYVEIMKRVLPSSTSYLRVSALMKTNPFTIWADIEGARNPRSGIAFGPYGRPTFLHEWSGIIGSFTTVHLETDDLHEISYFIDGERRRRYV